jgi:glycosyltransferase involved in cell wall biosynthesis
MACGLPVVATRVGGLPGIVPSEVGMLVPHGDEEALRAAVLGLARDDTRRGGMGDAARVYAERRFSLERMTSEYEGLYSG